ncbi:MAG: HEPN domain-containing protein [Methanomassiliicoccales archaeon]|nr:MAG: HEPN domain-containing protein [Methanomassiliicoccales archaeon]
MNLDECLSRGFLKRVRSDMENAQRSLRIQKECHQDALKNNEIECYRVVLILCYTSMFHASRAVLYRDGVKERSHICIPIYFRAKYPELDRYANILDSYRELRHGVFYRVGTTVDKREAEESLVSAKEFLAQIESFVSG